MLNYILSFGFSILIAFQGLEGFSVVDYDQYMHTWDENIVLAKEYLREAEKSLNNGDALDSCVNQRKASEYGLIATEARISAAEIKAENDIIPNLQDGLKKWKAFGDFCS